MGRDITPSPVSALVNFDKRFNREASELILLQIKYSDVAIDTIGNACALDFRFDKAPIQAAHHVAKFACALFDEIYLNDFTLGKPLLEFGNHGEFGSKENGIDVAIGFGKHERSTFHIDIVQGNDVGRRGIGNDDSIHINKGLKVKLKGVIILFSCSFCSNR